MIASYEELCALLEAERVPHERAPASRSVRLPTRLAGVDGVQIVRWQEGDGVVQFIQSVLSDVPEDRLAAVADAAARLNHVLPWPGLDVGHEHRLVAYRVALPIGRDGVEADMLRRCVRHTVRSAGELATTIARVASGDLDPADAVADARRALVGPTPHPQD